MCVSNEEMGWCSCVCVPTAHVYDVALCGNTVRNVAHGL